MDELLGLIGLWTDRHSPLAGYSKGMRQKVLLMASLLHDPELLILDEPFSGLDVNASMILRGLLDNLAERGKMGAVQFARSRSCGEGLQHGPDTP